MKIRPLSKNALRSIARHDITTYEAPKGGYTLCDVFAGAKVAPTTSAETNAYLCRLANRTRYYNWLVQRGQDVEIHTVAVKARKNGRREVKEVVRASVDNELVWVTDLACHNISGYITDWSREGLGRNRDWSYRGKWEYEPYVRGSGKWKIDCTVINHELLKRTKRFRYCAWNYQCGKILDYLKDYDRNPRIEFLVKAGMEHFATLRGFTDRLSENKAFMRFFYQNLETIKKNFYNVPVIYLAFKNGITLDAASKKIRDKRFFRGHGLPQCVDATRAGDYVRATPGLTPWGYCHYLKLCKEFKLDMADTKTLFPHDFHARIDTLRAQHDAIERRKNAELKRTMPLRFARVVQKFARLEQIAQPLFAVRIPRKEEDLVTEGKTLLHCVWQGLYAEKMADERCVIVFIRLADKPDTPWFTAEINAVSGKPLQIYGYNHALPPKNVEQFVFGKISKLVKKIAQQKTTERKEAV